MTTSFDGNNFVVDNDGQVIIFKCGSDYLDATENPDGSLTWSTAGDAVQVNRNRVSVALVDNANQTIFATLLITDPSTAFNTFLTQIP